MNTLTLLMRPIKLSFEINKRTVFLAYVDDKCAKKRRHFKFMLMLYYDKEADVSTFRELTRAETLTLMEALTPEYWAKIDLCERKMLEKMYEQQLQIA